MKDDVKRAMHATCWFALSRPPTTVVPHGDGLIHGTYRVDVQTPTGRRRFLLQRINRDVFRDVAGLMRNVERVLAHLHARNATRDAGFPYPVLVRTIDGEAWLDHDGAAWRMMSYVEGATSIDRAPTPRQAGQIGQAFGRLSADLRSLSSDDLPPVLPGYRNTEGYLNDLERAAAEDVRRRRRSARPEIARLRARRNEALTLQQLWRSGALPTRVVHGDTKLNNVLFDARGENALCAIDFDTVGSGLLLHDLGDCVRDLLAATAARGDLADGDVAATEALVRGFIRGMGVPLSRLELDHIVDAATSIALELAARFLTDDLQGDVYFRVNRHRENRDRAREHLHLADLLETNRARLDAAVHRAGAPR